MKEVQELIKIVTSNTAKRTPLLDLKDRKKGKEATLFQKIRDGEYTTDEEASRDLFGALPGNSVQYRMLKSRLRQKLLNHLFFLEFSGKQEKPSNRDEQEVLNLVHQARMLIKKGGHSLAESLLRQAIRLAEGLELTPILIDCLELLKVIYARNGKSQLFYKNLAQLEHYRKLEQVEREAEDLYYVSRLELDFSVRARQLYLPKLSPILDKLRLAWEETRLFSVFDYYYKLNMYYHELTGDFDKIIQLTAQCEKMLEAGEINAKRFEHRLNKFMSVYAHLRTKDLENGLRLAQEYLPNFDSSTPNWFAYLENYLLLTMYAQQYKQAHQLISEVENNPFFFKLSQRAKERWQLYRGYLYFLNPSEELLKSFNYQAFVATVPEYSKDKQGFHVAILILQFLHFLRNRDTDALLYRIESLRKYADKHLKNKASQRSMTFFKLLALAVREDFDYRRCRAKSAYLYKRLQSTPSPGDAYAEIEIVPYEQLWEIVLNILKLYK